MLIKDKKIDRISGPVSFALLKPKKFIFEELKKEGVHLPIFMLFGDIHFSGKYQCEKCTCGGSSSAFGSSSAGCCMPIYSNEFLRLIDSVATPENPVDFGIEGFYAGQEKENIKKEGSILYFKELARKSELEPMFMLRENNTACYTRELKGSRLYNKYCPTKNIRWHYMDARSAKGSKYDLEYLLHFLDAPYIENNFDKLIQSNNTNKQQIKNIIANLKSNFKDKTMFYNLLMLKYYIVSSPEKAMDYFFRLATPQNSLILKQFNKLSKSLKELEFWKKSMSEYLLYVLKKYEKENYALYDSEEINFIKNSRKEFYELLIKDDIDKLAEKLKDSKFQRSLKRTLLSSIKENSILMDMYYIFRTFKIPKGDKNPFLSLIYIGDAHREHITHFLSDIIKYYDIVSEVNIKGDFFMKQDPQMRCTYMPNFNLNDLALQYGVDIKKNSIGYVAPHYVEPPQRSYGGAPVRIAPVRRAPVRRSPVRRASGGRRRTPVKRASKSRRRAPAKRASANRRRSPARKTTVRRRSPARRASAGRRRR